jgi:hypothetical protein
MTVQGQPQGQGGDQGAQPSAGVQPQSQQPTGQQPTGQQAAADAAWNAKFKSPDEMWQSYGELEKRLGTQGNDLGTYKKAYDELAARAEDYQKAAKAWDEWYKKDLQPHWSDIDRMIKSKNGRSGQQQPQGQQQTTQDWAKDWDTFTPQQQAALLQQNAIQEIAGALGPALQNWQKQFTDAVKQEIGAKEQYFNNYLNLYRKVMDMRLQDPTLDIDSVLDQAVKVLSGNADPIELGKTLATMTSDRDSYAKTMVEKARADWEIQSATPAAGGTPPVFRVSSAGNQNGRGLASLRENVANKILEKHGPQVFNPY